MPPVEALVEHADSEVAGSRLHCQDFRQRNAADFVLREALDLVPDSLGASAWYMSSSRLHFVASLEHERSQLAAIGRYLSSIIGHLSSPDEPVTLNRVGDLFESALLVPVPSTSSAPCGYLLLASATHGAFTRPTNGMAHRLAQQLGQFWCGLTD
ncbi:MAG: hypothetical protein JJ896_11110 [Rhodothermales bacterium]|nr:hypothetical protein [Rhodothermales bacterium]MBO6780190.1 hypothetical protein [Rhodothermales bacterium]